MFVLLNRKFYKEAKMEDQLLVAKTLLRCYPHLDDLFTSLEQCEDECVKSGFYAIFPNEQMRLYDKIIAYEDRKVGIYNMKYMIEESFRKGKGLALSILKERYLSHREMNELMEEYHVSLRTCYRYLKRGLADLAKELSALGYDKKRIIVEYGNEPLFMTMLNRVIKEDDLENEDQERGKIDNLSRRPLIYCERVFSAVGRAQRG